MYIIITKEIVKVCNEYSCLHYDDVSDQVKHLIDIVDNWHLSEAVRLAAEKDLIAQYNSYLTEWEIIEEIVPQPDKIERYLEHVGD